MDSKGDVAVTGGAYNGTSWDYYTAKYASANGKLIWEKLYNGPSHLQDFVAAMAVDFLARNRLTDRPCRFDVVAIDLLQGGQPRITVIPFAFDAP